MPGSTPTYGLPFSELSDPPNDPQQSEAFAVAVDSELARIDGRVDAVDAGTPFLAVHSGETTREVGQDISLGWNATDIAEGGVTHAGTADVVLPAGLYQLEAHITADGATGNNSAIHLRRNSSTATDGEELSRSWEPNGGNTNITIQLSKTVRVAGGDVLRVYVSNNASSGTLRIIGGGPADTYLTAVRVGD